MKKVGLVGWRGMVGSVLMSRMQEEQDFAHIQPTFFTTSQAGEAAPNFGVDAGTLQDAFDIEALAKQDIIITAQGGDYTKDVYPAGRVTGLTPPPPCGWRKTPSSFWIRSTAMSSSRP